MLSTMRSSWLLYTTFALVALSSALNLEEALHIDGIEAYLHHGYKRQVSGTGNSAVPSETSSADETSQAPETSAEPSSTPPPETSADQSSGQPSETPAPSSEAPESSAAPSSPASSPATTQGPSRTTRTPVVSTSALVSLSIEPFTTIVFSTASDGQVQSSISVGSRTQTITTGTALYTDPASLNNGDGGSDGGGLSSENKKIIGGVVGGVGGAILLGGLAIVAWRIWGRKKGVSEDDDDLMAGTGSALGDKPQNPTANSPFQSNLEQYHNPGGRPNAAANF